LLLEEVLVKPGGTHHVVYVGPNAPVVTRTLYCQRALSFV